MASKQERILLIEDKREISDLIARQALQPLGYRVETATNVPTAIQETTRYFPDLIIANLKLHGLSSKDLLAALSSQGLEIPVIVLSERGTENDIIQAFRLGAADFLLWPAREAEVVSAVERILKQVRARREREALARQLQQTNQELQRRVRELTTLSAIGKAVTSITDHHTLFERIVEGAVSISEADSGWLLLREGQRKAFVLGAQRNLPEAYASRVDQPWEDGISSLVAVSGEPLSIHGEPIKRFKISRLGLSVLVMPVKAKKEVVGLLTVLRKAALPFGPNVQTLLSAVTDYASISIVNAHLFKALQERALRLQQIADAAQANERNKDQLLRDAAAELGVSLEELSEKVSALLAGEAGGLIAPQEELLRSAQENLGRIRTILESLTQA
jgi:two-component system NtrC family sensor kinase